MEWLWTPPVFFVDFWWTITIIVLAVAILWGFGSFVLRKIKGSRIDR